MIDSERQKAILMAMNEGKSELESLRDLTLSCPPTRPMGAIKDEADTLVECGWAKYKIDQVIVPDHVRIVLSLQDMIDLHRQNAKEESHE